MASQFTIVQIIKFAQISQYLAANDRSSLKQLQSGSFVGILPNLLYMEGTLLQNLNSLNPTSPNLRGTGEYVLSLCGKYLSQAQQILNNLAQSPPVLTGPTNQSVTVGNTATFSVSVTGTAPFTYQWFLNGVLIPGATSSSYAVVNAQLSQTGGLYSVQVTNPVTTITSNQATLTVTAALVGYYYQGNTDYSTDLLANNDDVAYLGTFPITTGQPLEVTFPNKGASQFVVVKYPATETTKANYKNPPPSGPDIGVIPDIAFQTATFGGWKYIFSRTGNQFGLNNSTGTVEFS